MISTNHSITFGENCRITAMKLRTYSSNLNKGTLTPLPPRNFFWMLRSTCLDLQQQISSLHTLRIFGVLFLSTLSISVLSLVFLKVVLSPSKQVIPTSPLQVSSDFVNTKNWLATGKLLTSPMNTSLAMRSQSSHTLIPPMKLDLIYMESGAVCTAGSTTTILLSSVIGLLVLNVYLITRLNLFVRGLKGGQQQNLHTPTRWGAWAVIILIKRLARNSFLLTMKCEVKLYVSGRIFSEFVEARDYKDARETALARNPHAKVITVNVAK